MEYQASRPRNTIPGQDEVSEWNTKQAGLGIPFLAAEGTPSFQKEPI